MSEGAGREGGRRPRVGRRIAAVAVAPAVAYGAVALLLASCVGGPPRPGSYTRQDRLQTFPESLGSPDAPVEILWNDRMVPYIFAESDDDAAYALGVVHAHLRLGQMELLKRVAQGRLAEMAGPLFAPDVDHAVRTLDLTRAVPEMAERLPDETRRWIERYVDGVNRYRESVARRPHDVALIGADLSEPWTVEDVLGIGRLASADINWSRWWTMLRLRDEPRFAEYAERMRRFHEAGTPSFGPETPTPLDPLVSMSRSGSNAMAVHASRSASGGALIASDPHLGLNLPNMWCLVGYRTPTHGAVGMTFAGLPFVLIGRNDHIAWGGTNMQALSSTLYDVSGLDEREFTTRRERIRVRFWFDRTAEITETPVGPLLSDAPFVRDLGTGPLAVRWRGHEPSDEATSFYKVSRATGWEEFREAFRTFATGGQNFLYADTKGNIGQVLATEYVPAAGRAAAVLAADPENPDHVWGPGIPSTSLPYVFNPNSGVVVSANNTPVRTDPPLTLSGNWNDRTDRLLELLDAREAHSADDLKVMQRDVHSASSLAASRALLGAMPEEGWSLAVVRALEGWDGRYLQASEAPAAYQLLLHHLLDTHYRAEWGESIARSLRSTQAVHDFVREDVEDGAIDADTLVRAARGAALDFGEGRTWGEMHRLRLRHPAENVPFIGRQYRFGDFPVDGTTGTINKTAHQITNRTHGTTYGANARHVSDMADPDANDFVIIGGQDGWMGSDHYLDQWELWRRGEFVRIPLREETVREHFRHRTVLTPSDGGEGR